MTETIRMFPAVTNRVEDGPIQFGDDWPGTFLRGDSSFGYAMALKTFMDNPDDALARMQVAGLLDTLRGCDLTRRTESPKEGHENG